MTEIVAINFIQNHLVIENPNIKAYEFIIQISIQIFKKIFYSVHYTDNPILNLFHHFQ